MAELPAVRTLQDELRSLERRGQAARKVAGMPSSRNEAVRASGLPKQTVSDWFSHAKPRVPKEPDELWRLVCLYGTWAGERPKRRYWTDLWESARSASRGAVEAVPGDLEPLGRKIDLWTDPLSLEIHPSIDAGASEKGMSPLPMYIDRAHDAQLRAVVDRAVGGESSLAILVGESSTGKTRACWEAVQALPEGWRLWHPIYPGHASAVNQAHTGRVSRRTVIWLNETQLYLRTAADDLGERVAAKLRELLTDPSCAPVLVLGTMWPEFWDKLTQAPRPGREDQHPQARALLSSAGIAVPSRFSTEALTAAEENTGADPRLAEAYAGTSRSGGRFTQYLAGVPVLLERYTKAPEAAGAVIRSAMDMRRLGWSAPVPETLLRDAAPFLMGRDVYDLLPEDWLERALEYATVPCRGIPGPLTRVRPLPGEVVIESAGYRLADYLEQFGRAEHAAVFVPEGFLDVLLREVDDVEQLRNIAGSLWERSRLFWAACFYRRAADLGDFDSGHQLADLLACVGDPQGAVTALEPQVSNGDHESLELFTHMLCEVGDKARAEEICYQEFLRGNAALWVEQRRDYEEADYEAATARFVCPRFPDLMGGSRHNDDIVRSIVRDSGMSEAEADQVVAQEVQSMLPRLQLLTRAYAASVEEMREQIRRLEEVMDEFRRSGQQEAVKALWKELDDLEMAGRLDAAWRLVLQAMNRGTMDHWRAAERLHQRGR